MLRPEQPVAPAHPGVTLGEEGFRGARQDPTWAVYSSQPDGGPARSAGQGWVCGRVGGARAAARASGAAGARARARRGAGRAARVAGAFPTPRASPAVPLSQLAPARPTCADAPASGCVCSRQTVRPARKGPVDTGGGRQLVCGRASVPSSPPQPFPLVSLDRGSSSRSLPLPPPSLPWKRPAPCDEGSGSPRLRSP